MECRQQRATFFAAALVDNRGHLDGYGSPMHLQRIELVDSWIGDALGLLADIDGGLEDTLVLCGFWSPGTEMSLQLLNASTGFDVTEEELTTALVPRWLALQRTLLILAGWSHEDDTNPPRFYEPLPSGPDKGMKVDKSTEQKNLQEAYRARGWDKRGIPTSETLEKLGLAYLDAALDPYR